MSGVLSGYLQVDRADNRPPTLTVTYIRQWMWHKHDPYLIERMTLEWDGHTYRLAKRERMATGWPYHLARFLAFVEAGRWDRAAEHMAAPPPEGAQAYVQRAGTDGPWFSFEFAANGRVQGVGRVQAPPARS